MTVWICDRLTCYGDLIVRLQYLGVTILCSLKARARSLVAEERNAVRVCSNDGCFEPLCNVRKCFVLIPSRWGHRLRGQWNPISQACGREILCHGFPSPSIQSHPSCTRHEREILAMIDPPRNDWCRPIGVLPSTNVERLSSGNMLLVCLSDGLSYVTIYAIKQD
jgi:hypothetical protein